MLVRTRVQFNGKRADESQTNGIKVSRQRLPQGCVVRRLHDENDR